jgi:hypothetical protein
MSHQLKFEALFSKEIFIVKPISSSLEISNSTGTATAIPRIRTPQAISSFLYLSLRPQVIIFTRPRFPGSSANPKVQSYKQSLT